MSGRSVRPMDPHYPWCMGCTRARQIGWHCAWGPVGICKSGDKFKLKRR
jgi:hypothetical protein